MSMKDYYGGEHDFRRECLGQWAPKHDYSCGWIDSSRSFIKWQDIDDRYLYNIHRKIQRSPNNFPGALRYCEEELRRRKPKIKVEIDRGCLDRIQETYNCRSQIDPMVLKNYCEQDVKNIMEANNMNAEQTTPTSTKSMILDSELGKYFNQKVITPSGDKGRVIQLNVHNSGMNQLIIKLQANGKQVGLNANEVQLVDVVKVYCYQLKDGTIELTSKQRSAQSMKRQGVKHLANGDKEIDL